MKVWIGIAAVCLACWGALYCYRGQKPSKAPPPAPGAAAAPAAPVAQAPRPAAPLPPKPANRYQGRTAEEWGQILAAGDREAVWAGYALRILGAEGRPYLLRGLENPNPQVRRISLENLTISDVRSYGEQGRQVLLKLAGDPADIHIRDRANVYLAQWNQTLPAPR